MKDYRSLASELVSELKKQGAEAADVYIVSSVGFNTMVRLGKIERLQQSTSKGLGLRVIKNGALLATPFLTVTTTGSGERGLGVGSVPASPAQVTATRRPRSARPAASTAALARIAMPSSPRLRRSSLLPSNLTRRAPNGSKPRSCATIPASRGSVVSCARVPWMSFLSCGTSSSVT